MPVSALNRVSKHRSSGAADTLRGGLSGKRRVSGWPAFAILFALN